MNTTNTIAYTKLQYVVLLWDYYEGFHYVGPFADEEAASAWGRSYEELTGSYCWHCNLLDPAAPLEIRAPDAVALDPDPDPWLDGWEAPQSDTPGAAFHLLMTDGDPLHLAGPFADHRMAVAWAKYNEQTRRRDFGWWVVWLEIPTAPVRLLSVKQAEELAANGAGLEESSGGE
jgi:hypothetical protein